MYAFTAVELASKGALCFRQPYGICPVGKEEGPRSESSGVSHSRELLLSRLWQSMDFISHHVSVTSAKWKLAGPFPNHNWWWGTKSDTPFKLRLYIHKYYTWYKRVIEEWPYSYHFRKALRELMFGTQQGWCPLWPELLQHSSSMKEKYPC